MIKQLCDIRNFLLRLRTQFRFGRLSRAPLRLLRLELRGDFIDCDWIARPPDRWDASLPERVGERNASLQALEDAIAVRDLLFYTLPGLSNAAFRVYRQIGDESPDLILTGEANRSEPIPSNVDSLPMRAKLCGFQFRLVDGNLEALQTERVSETSKEIAIRAQ